SAKGRRSSFDHPAWYADGNGRVAQIQPRRRIVCKRISNGARYAGSMSVVRSVDGFEQWDQRRDIEKREIRPGYGRVQLNAASIDPGNRQAERLSADHVGELRLAGMENFVPRHAGMVDEVAEQGPVWLVTSCTF